MLKAILKRGNKADNLEEPPTLAQFFDAGKFPEHAVFLKRLGISKPAATQQRKTTADLSNLYSVPRHQYLPSGQATKACTAFAAVSDMEVVGKTPPLSAGLAYGLARATIALWYSDNGHDLSDQTLLRVKET